MKSVILSIAAGGLLVVPAIAQPARHSDASPHFRIVDLGTLGGPACTGCTSAAFQINDAGQVAGSSSQTPGGPQTAVIWSGPGQLRDLGTLGGPNSGADGPNGKGEAAVGSETANLDPNNEDFCGFGTHHQCLGAVWRGAALTRLSPLPGGNNDNAFDLNNHGLVVGFSENGVTDSTCISATPFQVTQFLPVIWDADGNIRPLPLLKGDQVGFGLGINNNGETVGASGLCSNTSIPPFPGGPAGQHAVLWDKDGTPTDLGSLGSQGGTLNIANAINNRGEVTGGSRVDDGTIHAFLWTKQTGMLDYGAIPGAVVTVAACCNTINDRGEMAGFAIDGTTFTSRAILWVGKTPAYLENPSDSPFSTLIAANSINNAGEIVGQGMTTDGELHAFMAIPR